MSSSGASASRQGLGPFGGSTPFPPPSLVAGFGRFFLTPFYRVRVLLRLQLAQDSGDAAAAQLKGVEQRLKELQDEQRAFEEKEKELER